MRPRPCSPGGYERRSIAHFSVRQRSPFRKSFIPSRRHCLHFGERSRAIRRAASSWDGRRSAAKNAAHFPREFCRDSHQQPLDSPPLLGTDAVVRLRRDVAHAEDLEPRCLERADRRLTARTGPLDEDLDLLQAVLHPLARARVGGHLCSKRRRLAGALEAGRAGGLPRDHVSVLVGERDDRVVERRLDVRLTDSDVLAHTAPRATAGRLSTRGGHLGFRRCFLAAADGLLRALARARVRLRPLAVDRQAAAVTDAAVRADLAESLDGLRPLAAQIALDLEIRVDVLAQLRHFLVGEVLDLRVGRETELGADLLRGRLTDPVDVRQPDLEPLVIRKIDSSDAREISLLALPLLVPRVRPNDHGPALPLNDAAPLTHGLD